MRMMIIVMLLMTLTWYIYDIEEDDPDVEPITNRRKYQFIDDPDEEPTANFEHDFIDDPDTEEGDGYGDFIPDDFVAHSFMNN